MNFDDSMEMNFDDIMEMNFDDIMEMNFDDIMEMIFEDIMEMIFGAIVVIWEYFLKSQWNSFSILYGNTLMKIFWHYGNQFMHTILELFF